MNQRHKSASSEAKGKKRSQGHLDARQPRPAADASEKSQAPPPTTRQEKCYDQARQSTCKKEAKSAQAGAKDAAKAEKAAAPKAAASKS